MHSHVWQIASRLEGAVVYSIAAPRNRATSTGEEGQQNALVIGEAQFMFSVRLPDRNEGPEIGMDRIRIGARHLGVVKALSKKRNSLLAFFHAATGRRLVPVDDALAHRVAGQTLAERLQSELFFEALRRTLRQKRENSGIGSCNAQYPLMSS